MARTGGLRVVAAVMWAAVVLVAVLGTSVGASTLELCGGSPCDHHSAPADTDHDFPSHDPCLHDNACGGGGALGHGPGFVAVFAETEDASAPRLAIGALRPMATTLTVALFVGGVERPPRFSA